MGIAGTINQHGKITISLGTGNVATLKGDLDETGTDTAEIVCATDSLSSDGGDWRRNWMHWCYVSYMGSLRLL